MPEMIFPQFHQNSNTSAIRSVTVIKSSLCDIYSEQTEGCLLRRCLPSIKHCERREDGNASLHKAEVLPKTKRIINWFAIPIGMKKGRPVRSVIRQNVVEILHHLGQGYGYQISKIYNEVFPTVTQRSIYYHLRKGMKTKEIEVYRVEKENGNFSWGSIAEKIYYRLGKKADPKGNAQVKDFVRQWKK